MVDRLTGLMWSRDFLPLAECGWAWTGPFGVTKSWSEAMSYVSCLNGRSYLGHDDWRMPNRQEMRSLFRSLAVPLTMEARLQWLKAQGFQFALTDTSIMPTTFLTSNLAASASQCARQGDATSLWVSSWYGGEDYSLPYDRHLSVWAVWPVRDAGVKAAAPVLASGVTSCYDGNCNRIDCAGTGQDGELRKGMAWPSPRFVKNADSTIKDGLTGLVWGPNGNLPNENPADAPITSTWSEALAMVEGLNAKSYLGHTDWRLPNINELGTLALGDNTESSLDSQLSAIGLRVRPGPYWSSTWGVIRINVTDVEGAWIVNFVDGRQDVSAITNVDHALLLPVRGP